MQVAFGEWLPDQASHLNPGANVANNVYYAATSYKPFPSLVSYSTNTTTTDARELDRLEIVQELYLILYQQTLIYFN